MQVNQIIFLSSITKFRSRRSKTDVAGFACHICQVKTRLYQRVEHKRSSTRAHLSILMIHKQIPHALVVQVGDLQAVSMADLLWLENCIQVLHGDDRFGDLGL